MSRRKPRHHTKQRSTPAIPHALRPAYQEFVAQVLMAHQEAAIISQHTALPAADVLDLSRAITILRENPPLERFLRTIQRREDARTTAMTTNSVDDWQQYAVPGMPPPDFLTKGRPTDAQTTGEHRSGGAWVGSRPMPEGVPNARLLREWADTNEWVRAAVNARKQQIGRADIAVVPLDEKRPFNTKLMKQVQLLLDQPNELRDSYRSLIEPIIEDILVLDRGVIEKAFNLKHQPAALYAQDGATIKIFPDWDGQPDSARYLYEDPATGRKVTLRNEQAIVITANPATYRYCLSPVQVLRNTIQADLAATKSAMHIVEQKPPPHIVQVPGMGQTMLRQLRNDYEYNVAGRREIFFMGGDQEVKAIPLIFSARDNQWLEWQTWLARKICAVFSISPQQVGITFDINKSTGQTQQQVFEDTGLIPLLLLLEEYLNREFLADFAPTLADGRSDLTALNLRIIYPEVSEAARQFHYEKVSAMGNVGLQGLPSMTLNQVLALRGEAPVPGGNTFYVKTASGAVPWLSYDGITGDYVPVGAQGGALGGQDAAGGPAEQTTPVGGTSGDDAVAPNFNEPGDYNTPGDASPADAAASSTATDFRASLPFPSRQDHRAPGKQWRVSAMEVIPMQKHGKRHPHDAASHLSNRVKTIFADVAKRGERAMHAQSP